MKRDLERLFKNQEYDKLHLKFLDLQKRKKIKRSEYILFASYLRRISRPLEGVKLLNPIIRSEKLLELPTDLEKIEYASCLYRVGLRQESLKLLNECKKEHSQKILYKAFINFSKWKYQEASELLKYYLTLGQLSERDIFIGRLNLLSSEIFLERFSQATELLDKCKKYARDKKLKRYMGNLFELEGQIYFAKNKDKQARKSFDKATSFLVDGDKLGNLFALKWKAILELTKDKKLYSLALKTAKNLAHWESVRSLQYYRASKLQDKALLEQVYLGTPYQSFRDMIIAKNPEFHLNIHALDFQGKKYIFDRFKFEFSHQKRRKIKPFSLEGKLLSVLSEDYFRPMSGYQVFEKLYPNEFFIPKTSINKTHKVISRTIKKFRCIQNLKGAYSLKSTRVLYEKNGSPPSIYQLQIKEKFPQTFRTKQVCELFELSHRQMTRVLKQLIDQEQLKLISAGRSSYYEWI